MGLKARSTAVKKASYSPMGDVVKEAISSLMAIRGSRNSWLSLTKCWRQQEPSRVWDPFIPQSWLATGGGNLGHNEGEGFY